MYISQWMVRFNMVITAIWRNITFVINLPLEKYKYRRPVKGANFYLEWNPNCPFSRYFKGNDSFRSFDNTQRSTWINRLPVNGRRVDDRGQLSNHGIFIRECVRCWFIYKGCCKLIRWLASFFPVDANHVHLSRMFMDWPDFLRGIM